MSNFHFKLELTFAEILSISREENDETNIDDLIINTVQKEDFVFKCYEAVEVVELTMLILDTIKKNSIYAVVVQVRIKSPKKIVFILSLTKKKKNVSTCKDYTHPENSDAYLKLTKGDLITFESGTNGEIVMNPQSTWCRGECNGVIGEFPTDVVYVLPSLSPPRKKIVKLFKDGAVQPRKHAATNYNTLQRQKMHNLRRYANENFRAHIE